MAQLVSALAPWANGRSFPNFAESPIDPASAYEADAWARLRAVKAAVDPDGTLPGQPRDPRRRLIARRVPCRPDTARASRPQRL